MKATRFRLALAALAAISVVAISVTALADPAGAGKITYRWVDDKGVVHYGDNVPPEYTKRERVVLNNQGVEVSRLAAQRTAEQQAEDLRLAEAQRKLSQHDNFLLTSYLAVRDIEQLRDSRLQQLADQRRSTEAYIDALNTRIGQLQTRAQIFRPYSDSPTARPMPPQLAEDIVRTVNELRTQRAGLEAKRTEENNLRQRFQLDIDRYRQLKQSGAAATPAH